jgi:hypothetical protein
MRNGWIFSLITLLLVDAAVSAGRLAIMRSCQFIDGITGPGRIDVRDGDSCASRRERPRDRASDAFAPASDYQGAHAVQGASKVVHGRIFPSDRRRAGVG